MTREKIRERTDRAARPRAGAEVIAALASRLTERDRQIIALVAEHRVLTTRQIAAMFFTRENKARDRLLELHRLTALERFRPWAPKGSQPWHWVLGPGGAHVMAAQTGVTPTAYGYRRDAALAICHSPLLAHQVGVNEFFTRLRALARTDTGAELAAWWSEKRCAQMWSDITCPDAYGRWRQNGAEFDFFLEYDTGTEPLTVVAEKLPAYAELAEATGITTPVLFWLPSARREQNLRRVVGTPDIPVATASSAEGPAAPVWLPAGTTEPRLRLIDLAGLWPPQPPDEK